LRRQHKIVKSQFIDFSLYVNILGFANASYDLPSTLPKEEKKVCEYCVVIYMQSIKADSQLTMPNKSIL